MRFEKNNTFQANLRSFLNKYLARIFLSQAIDQTLTNISLSICLTKQSRSHSIRFIYVFYGLLESFQLRKLKYRRQYLLQSNILPRLNGSSLSWIIFHRVLPDSNRQRLQYCPVLHLKTFSEIRASVYQRKFR